MPLYSAEPGSIANRKVATNTRSSIERKEFLFDADGNQVEVVYAERRLPKERVRSKRLHKKVVVNYSDPEQVQNPRSLAPVVRRLFGGSGG